ncbi:DUF2480 family protein [Yeosuana sp. MJ-SS3]|jgi:hypothetical protein|uniref:DUF2480 family protein n=1 Tax=Gilvirhabdus luticola TaxID=3079858 RepID=A0ABU3U3F2_9FLAO|nr:DUF2480 family protein [Yeosuana sp. MJ-SS3]MDU8884862.1 DUF2480 family protein [Yeosuana sp. MJ-SS3]
MAEEIVNRVANSKLVTIDLEDYYPVGKRVLFDIKDWLFQELVIREKEFRDYVKQHDWVQYKDSYVALSCSADAIIPSWAYLLIASKLSAFAKKIIVGNLVDLENSIYQDIISNLDLSNYKDKPIIIKGCSNKPIPDTAYTLLISKLINISKSIMFGEACSTVPLYKKK